MRWLLVGIAVILCAAAVGQPAAQPGRGMDFRFSGPASEMLPAFEAALGMGVEPNQLPKALSGAEGEKPVQVSLKGARMFDILAAVEKAIGKRLEFAEGMGQLRPSPLPGRVGESPGYSTPNCDVMLERVERGITYPLTWGDKGPVVAPRQSVLTLTLRTYPADAWAAERMVGYMQPGLTLVHPDGKQDAINLGPGMSMNFFSVPFVRCLRTVSRAVPVADLPAGEYKLDGAVLMAKVDPVASPALTAADVGRAVDLGAGAKVTVRSWAGPQ